MDPTLLRPLILDQLTIDIECIDTMIGAHDLAEKRQVAEVIASAIDDGLIEPMEHARGMCLGGYGRVTPAPTVDEIEHDSYPPGRYRFDLTPAGKQILEDSADGLRTRD